MVNRSVVLLSLFNIVLFGCSVAFVWSAAQSNYGVAKPWVLEFTPTSPVIKLEKFDLATGYDVDSGTYKIIYIFLTNMGSSAMGAGVSVVMYDTSMSKICEGTTSTPMIAPEGTFELNMPLVWVPGTRTIDVMFVRIAIQEYKVT